MVDPVGSQAEAIARALLGAPNQKLSSEDQLRYGSNGSLAIEIAGDRIGAWYDHEHEVGGRMLDLVMRERRCDEANARAWLKSKLGIETGNGAAEPQRRVAAYIYKSAGGEPLFCVSRWGPLKTFTQERYDPETGKFVGGKGCMDGVQRVPYRLDEWADEDGGCVFIVEGEKDADRLAGLGLRATTNPGGAGKWSKTYIRYFANRDVVVLPDNDQAGHDHARDVAASLQPAAKSVRVVALPGLPPKGDVSDWLTAGGSIEELTRLVAATARAVKGDGAADIAQIEQLIEQAGADPGAPFEAETIDFLAALRGRDKAAYERARARLKAKNVRVGELDQEVERRQQSDESGAKGKALDLPEPEPWPEPVDGAELIAGLVEQIARYVILSEHAALAVALWTLHAHAHDAAFHSPRLTATSPTMRCGKSTLLRTIGRLVPRPLPTANITPAAMFRVVEGAKPTLLIDEADSFVHENEELRGVINSSHCCLDAYVVRAVPAGDEYEARRFSTWAPMAIASIGKVAATIADRSLMIGMERKAPGQSVARMRADRDDGFGVLASKAARWVADHLEALRQADPDVPRALNDRQADNWRPLFAIADLAGDDWPTRSRAAALALSATDEDGETIGVQMLASVRVAFATAEQISTENLLRHLHAMTEAPWGEYGRQRKPITPRQLASLLRPFGIASGTIRESETSTPKGYRRVQFENIWLRYLSGSATTPHARETATFGDSLSATTTPDVADRKDEKARQSASCGVVADGPPIPVQEAENDGCGMTLEDLERMGGESDDDGFAEFDEWVRPS